jgi:CBS domain-containing protein
MAQEVVTINSEFSVKYAAKLMSYFSISSLIAMKGENIDGILTERDVLTRVVAKGLDPERTMVRDIMTRPVMVVSPTTPLLDAVKTMVDRHIKKLPVVTGEDDNPGLLGILSLTDVARLHPMLMDAMKSIAEIPEPKQEVGFYVR